MRAPIVLLALAVTSAFAAKLRQEPTQAEAVTAPLEESVVNSDVASDNYGASTSNLVEQSSVQAQWNCQNFGGNWNPVVFDPATREIACAAPDSRNCLWTKSSAECSAVVGVWDPKSPVLKCGSDHASKYGIK